MLSEGDCSIRVSQSLLIMVAMGPPEVPKQDGALGKMAKLSTVSLLVVLMVISLTDTIWY